MVATLNAQPALVEDVTCKRTSNESLTTNMHARGCAVWQQIGVGLAAWLNDPRSRSNAKHKYGAGGKEGRRGVVV